MSFSNREANAVLAGYKKREENYQDAVRFARVAHDQGFAMGTRILAECYEYGLGVESNYNEFKRLMRIAALQGDPPAIARMCEHYDDRFNYVTDTCDDEWMKRAYYARLYYEETCNDAFNRFCEIPIPVRESILGAISNV